MSKGKLVKFAELATFSNTLQTMDVPRGCWSREYFGNDNEIILELACGKGDYTIQLARHYPEKNFIGVDIKGARLWRGAKMALDNNLKNVAFIRNFIENLTELFSESEISEIWITFPDPYTKRRKAKKRLTSPRFLGLYRKVLKKGGLIHLKTDEKSLFEFTQEIIGNENCILHEKIDNLYANPIENELLSIKTTYEKSHLEDGRIIRYLCFSFE